MKRALFPLILLFCSITISAQQPQQESRLLRLIAAKSAEMIQQDGRNIKKVSGNAQFLHNNTYIICDSAIWDVTTNILDAKGNVQIIQKNTRLTSDLIHYIADENVAQFRGNLVELTDKDNNRLRTMVMDYFTKDSIAKFNYGGSILDKDSNAIESYSGTYNAKERRYIFTQNVEVKNDSLVAVADTVEYYPDLEQIWFRSRVKAWRGKDFMKFNRGILERVNEVYKFSGSVYMNTPDQEIWADSATYRKKISNAELFGNVQILDTAQSALFFGDYAKYLDNPQRALLTKKPSVAYYSVEKGVADTLYISSDTIRFDSKLYSQVDSTERSISEKRNKLANQDAFNALLATLDKAPAKGPDKGPAKGATKGPAKSPAKGQINTPPLTPPAIQTGTAIDSVKIPGKDSLALTAPKDTVAKAKPESPPDSLQIKYVYAYKNVRIHRSNLQGICDSMIFTSLDSIARLYGKPLMWHKTNQFSSDSLQMLIKNKSVNKVELMSQAFTIAKEDSTHFNQIKAANIVGYFTDGELSRFDALGGVSVIFFFAEDSILTTMNQKECRAMKADIVDNNINKVKYIQEIKSNAYPLYKLEENKQKLKGFNWDETKRPKNRFEVCDRNIYETERESVLRFPLPYFAHTNRYFKFKTRFSPDIQR